MRAVARTAHRQAQSASPVAHARTHASRARPAGHACTTQLRERRTDSPAPGRLGSLGAAPRAAAAMYSNAASISTSSFPAIASASAAAPVRAFPTPVAPAAAAGSSLAPPPAPAYSSSSSGSSSSLISTCGARAVAARISINERARAPPAARASKGNAHRSQSSCPQATRVACRAALMGRRAPRRVKAAASRSLPHARMPHARSSPSNRRGRVPRWDGRARGRRGTL